MADDPLDDAPEMVPFVTGAELEQRMAEAVAVLPPGSVATWEGPWRPTSLRQEMKRRRLELLIEGQALDPEQPNLAGWESL